MLKRREKVVLSLGAHPDDAEFMCAGTLALLHEKGWEVHIATMTPGDGGTVEYSREEISRIRKGEAARAAAILDGDLVICEPRQFAENGEIIVALVHQEEATVKRFFMRKNFIELRPENSAFKPMTYAFNEVLIQGKVIGVHRGPEVIERI